ncbi:MAG: hypothetical protein V4649_11465 [Bacteroidota bacterium]
MEIVEPIVVQLKKAQLARAHHRVTIARLTMGIFMLLFAYNAVRLYFYSQYPEPYVSKLAFQQAVGAFIYAALIVLSFWRPLIAFILLTLITIGLFIYSFPGLDGIVAKVTILLTLIVILMAIYGALYAQEYEQLRAEVKASARLEAQL